MESFNALSQQVALEHLSQLVRTSSNENYCSSDDCPAQY